ncbi:MAG: glycosyltransferase family 39 protein, partial [Candidatus Riflebacteria bacterium]|nr:glycosyltransferase family 39 protein [Candidatus Riflebacteria bacterium]
MILADDQHLLALSTMENQVAPDRTPPPAGWPRWPSFPGCLALLVASTLSVWPLLVSGPLPDGSEASRTLLFARGFVDAIGEGVFFPRWIDDANDAMGAPVFEVHPPLAYYAVAVVQLVTGELIEAIRWTVVLAALLACLLAFLAARTVTSEPASVVAGALYVLLPSRMIELYGRFSLVDLIALTWLPLVWLFARMVVVDGSPRARLGLVVSLTASIAIQPLVALVTALAAVPCVLSLALELRRPRSLLTMLACCGASLLCAAAYLVPLALEQGELRHEPTVQA